MRPINKLKGENHIRLRLVGNASLVRLATVQVRITKYNFITLAIFLFSKCNVEDLY